MKRTALILGFVATAFLLTGCNDHTNPVYNSVPAAPQGVYSITGNTEVEIVWNGVYERDIDSYVIYRSFQSTTGYTEIGQVAAVSNRDLDLIIYSFFDDNLVNGQTYFYAVSAVDRAGQESPLSAEEVFDTPRPEGSINLYSRFTADSSLSGLALDGTPSRLLWNSSSADVYLDDAGGIYYLNAGDINTDIQDVGYTASFDEIGYAPADGWSELGYVELIVGHTYIIWTNDLHYAKMRVDAIDDPLGRVSFQWAYQTDTDNPELAPALPGGEKPKHGSDYLQPNKTIGAETL